MMNAPPQDFMHAYRQYADSLFRHCYFRVFNKERAEELVQDIFMKTWDYLCEGNTIQTMRPFLYKVANNLIINEARKHKEHSLEELELQGFQPVSHELPLPEIMEGKEMRALLLQVEAPYREIITMRYLDDLTPKEIAEVLGVSADVVSVRIHRGLAKLRTLVTFDV